MSSSDIKGKIGKEDLQLWGGGSAKTFQRRTSDGSLITLHKTGLSVDVLQIYGDGSTPAHVNLVDAIAAIEGAECCFELAPGTWPITSNLTIPSTVTVYMRRGAVFSVSAGVTLTISGPVFAEDTVWYSGSGTISVAASVSQITGAAIKAGTTLECGTTLIVGTTLAVGTDATVGGTLGVTGQTTAVNLSASGTLGGKLAYRGAQVYHSVVQSIPTATTTKLTFDTEAYDTSSIHDPSTNNTRLTVPAGVTRVRLHASIGYAVNAVGYRHLFLYKNLADVGPGRIYLIVPALAAGSTFINSSTAILTVVAGDYFEMCAYQDSGSSLNTAASGVDSGIWFEMEIIE